MELRTNGGLKIHVLFWKCWLHGQITQNASIHQWIKMPHRASLVTLCLRLEGNRLHSFYLIAVCTAFPNSQQAERNIFSIYFFFFKLYFLYRQDKWKACFLNYHMLLRAPVCEFLSENGNCFYFPDFYLQVSYPKPVCLLIKSDSWK